MFEIMMFYVLCGKKFGGAAGGIQGVRLPTTRPGIFLFLKQISCFFLKKIMGHLNDGEIGRKDEVKGNLGRTKVR